MVDLAAQLEAAAKTSAHARKLASLAGVHPQNPMLPGKLDECLIQQEKWSDANASSRTTETALQAKVLLHLATPSKWSRARSFLDLPSAWLRYKASNPSGAELFHGEVVQRLAELFREAQAHLLAGNRALSKSCLSSAMTEGSEGFPVCLGAKHGLSLCRQTH